MIDQSILSNLAFHPYLAFILHMAGDGCRWSRAASNDDPLSPFTGVNKRLSKLCRDRREKMESNARRYCLENLGKISAEFDEIPPGLIQNALDEVFGDDFFHKNQEFQEKHVNDVLEKLETHVPNQTITRLHNIIKERSSAGHLCRPLCTVSLGHTDNLSLLMIDEISYSGLAFETPDLPIQQTCIALCPDLKKLFANDLPGYICNYDDIFSSFQESPCGDVPKFEYTQDRPLIVVTYYRTIGLCNLGSGLLFQEAIIKKVKQRIDESLEKLKNISNNNKYINTQDIESLRCAFLLPVGWADFCTVMFATNYSVILTLLSEIRDIKFQDLYEVMDGAYNRQNVLSDVVSEFKLHSRLAEWENKFRKGNRESIPEEITADPMLAQNHIFCSTVTTLSIDHHAFSSDTDITTYRGLVSADPHFNLSPGHTPQVLREAKLRKRTLYSKLIDENDKRVVWSTTGLYDATDRAAFKPASLPEIPLHELLKRIKELRGISYKPGRERLMWGIQDIFTEVFIPELVLDEGSFSHDIDKKHVNIHPLLAELRFKLFEEEKGDLNISQLNKNLIELRMPSSMRGAILRCYTDFAKAMGDPLLFDNVLDIYDLFASVYRLFTKEMLDSLRDGLSRVSHSKLAQESCKLSFLHEGTIYEVGGLIELMQDAIGRRTEVGFRQARLWQEAIDYRRGLSKLISAVDVPIKCGLNILRRIMRNQVDCIIFSDYSDKKRDDKDTRTRVGGVSRISHYTSAMIRRFELGEKSTNFIADIRLNISHLTRPESLLTHLHETGHLIYDLLRSSLDSKDDNAYGILPCETATKSYFYKHQIESDWWQVERHEEIFSEMFVFGFIFGSDKVLFNSSKDMYPLAQVYLKQHLAAYFFDPVSMHPEPNISLQRLTEVLIISFLAIDPFLAFDKSKERTISSLRIGNDHSNIQSARERFDKLINDCGQIFFDFRRFWKNPASHTYILETFDKVYQESYRMVACSFDCILKIFESVFEEVDSKGFCGTSPPIIHQVELIEQFEKGYKDSSPILRFLYIDPQWEATTERKELGELRKHLDATYVMRHLLRIHIQTLFSSLKNTTECCFLPDIFSPDGTNDLILDRQVNGLMSLDFESRRKFLQGRIQILTTLWDLSTAIKARNLRRLLDEIIV